ncbi:EamA family transporter [Candidatus Woesearchaeota archaeon]|nr:EamA family transporter [Candidatus Woesearchaeota archaeon]
MFNGFAFILVIVATLIGAFGSLFLKKGSKNLSFNLISLIKNKDLVMGVALYVISSVFYIFALNYGELSMLYPLTSLAYVWVSLISIRFLNEKMNRIKWIGIILIIIGVFLVAR